MEIWCSRKYVHMTYHSNSTTNTRNSNCVTERQPIRIINRTLIGSNIANVGNSCSTHRSHRVVVTALQSDVTMKQTIDRNLHIH
jgi:hypothetical protein